MDGTAGIGATSNADNGQFGKVVEREIRCAAAGFGCQAYGCRDLATGVAETSDNRGTISTTRVCDDHAEIFLQTVRALQLNRCVRADFLGVVRGIGVWDRPVPYTLASPA